MENEEVIEVREDYVIVRIKNEFYKKPILDETKYEEQKVNKYKYEPAING